MSWSLSWGMWDLVWVEEGLCVGVENHVEGELCMLFLSLALMCRRCKLPARPPVCTLGWPEQS